MRIRLRALWLLVVALVAGAVLMAMATQATPAPVTAPIDESTPQQPPPPPPGPPGGPLEIERLAVGLDLSTTQTDQIKALVDQERTDSQAYQEQLREVRDNLRAIVESGTFDETAVRALATVQAKAEFELTIIHVRTQIAIYQLLTVDQRAKLAEMLKNPPPRPGRPVR